MTIDKNNPEKTTYENLCKLDLRPKFGLRIKSDLFFKSPNVGSMDL